MGIAGAVLRGARELDPVVLAAVSGSSHPQHLQVGYLGKLKIETCKILFRAFRFLGPLVLAAVPRSAYLQHIQVQVKREVKQAVKGN